MPTFQVNPFTLYSIPLLHLDCLLNSCKWCLVLYVSSQSQNYLEISRSFLLVMLIFCLVKYVGTIRLFHSNYEKCICLIVHILATLCTFQAVSSCIYWIPSVAHLPNKGISKQWHLGISVESGRCLWEILHHHGREMFP